MIKTEQNLKNLWCSVNNQFVFFRKREVMQFLQISAQIQGQWGGSIHAFLSSEMPTTLQLSIPLHCLDICLLTCFRNLKYLSLTQSILFF